MKATLKKWIAALRSGKYKRGNNFLYCGFKKSYCALGVYAKLCGKTNAQLEGKLFLPDVGIKTIPTKKFSAKEIIDLNAIGFKTLAAILENGKI